MSSHPPALGQGNESVSALIAHYGPARRTYELIGDLKRQHLPPTEIIIVDDCSPERFPEVPGVSTIRHHSNAGFGAAINTAAARASGAWLLILNNDVRLDSHFVDNALTHAHRWQPAICGFRQVNSTGALPPSGPFPTLVRTLAQRSDALQPLARRMGWTRSWQLDDAYRTDEREVDWIGGAALLLRRVDFEAVGGFDSRFFMYHEEIDLQRRLQARGVRSVVLGGLSVTHEGGATTASLDVDAERLRSRLQYEEFTFGRRRRKLLLLGLKGSLAIDAAYHRIRGVITGQPGFTESVTQRRMALKLASRDQESGGSEG